ncbi:MAG: GldG family protein [Clostridia bacterium]|nr:GldG family protein [Clostridia bacterium]
MNILRNKKFRYGSVSVALTVVIIVAVILLNAIVTALVHKNELYLDMTAENVFTLSDSAKDYLSPIAEKERRVKIIFCAAEDEIESDPYTYYAYHTAKDIREYLGDECVELEFVDIIKNPTKLKPYFTGESTSPNAYAIILAGQVKDEAGNWKDAYTQVYSATSLFYGDSQGNVIGYNGEQRLVSGILTVTQTEQPIVCFTTNHGETTPAGTAFKVLLEDCGFKVQTIDLWNEEIPEDCTLVVINNPDSDFNAVSEYSKVSEITKLEKFLDEKKALMVFLDSETGSDSGLNGKLPNLEDFLAQWGIGLSRQTDDSGIVSSCYMIEERSEDKISSVVNVGTYIKGGLGRSINAKLLAREVQPTVLFPQPAALINTYRDYDSTTDSTSGVEYTVYKSDTNMNGRRCYDVFTSSVGATAMLNGKEAALSGPFSYMKITQETHEAPETAKGEAYSYVLACSSTQFVADGALVGQYGNHTVLTRACHEMGASAVSVSLDAKYFTDTTIETITVGAINTYTVVLTVIPALAVFVTGIVIMVRRKYR